MPSSQRSLTERLAGAAARLDRRALVAPGKRRRVVRDEDLVYAEYDRAEKRMRLVLAGGEGLDYPGGVADLLRELPKRFGRIGRYHVVDRDRIREVSGAPGRYKLFLEGADYPVELSRAMEDDLREYLGVYTLDHPTPIPPSQRVLKEKGLIDFGYLEYLEYLELDKEDPAAVAAFKARWDLRRFDGERLKKYFLEVTTKAIDVEKFIRNLLWQTYSWIKWGIREPYEGNVRTYWYEVQAALGHQTDLIADVSPRSYNRALNEMIHEEGLFKYRDIGFFDVRSRFRVLGEEDPRLLLVGEKIGHFHRIRKMAQGHGVTFGCTKGQTSHIMGEYFSRELVEEGGVDPAEGRVHVFMITDFDWAGSSIASNFEKLLRKELETDQVVMHPVVRLEDFADEDVEWGRTVAARYVLEGGKPVPYAGTSRRVMNSALEWFEGVQDPRLKSVEETAGKQVHTIWKVSVDTLDWDVVRQRFESLLGAVRDGTWEPEPGDIVGGVTVPPSGASVEWREPTLELDPWPFSEADLD